MNVNIIKNGDIIESPRWPEPVKVDLIEIKGNYIKIVGSLINSRKHIDDLIELSQFNDFKIFKDKGLFNAESWKVFLAVEALRYRYASLYDPLLAVNISKVDPLPHQIEAVYGYILKQPRIRFLIADDPGAGKTIMAGLIIKELKLRHVIKRILIICPGHLKDQWKRELKERFEETFEIVDRARFDSVYRVNVWDKENQIITSIDFAKKDEVLQTLASTHFDLTIVDEAHKMSAYKYGEKVTKSERYKLGEVISHISNNLIFLTATPHKGDSENFRLFIDLLERGFFATTDQIQQSLENKDNPLFIRRVKEDLKDFEGRPLFLPRYVNTVKFSLSNEETELYNELSRYVIHQYNTAIEKDKRRNVAFALAILQRRLASSTYALLKSLERRKEKLEDLLKNSLIELSENNNINDSDIEEIDDLPEEERENIEKKWETITIAKNKDELLREISTLEILMAKAKNIINSETEVKLTKLKESLQELKNRVAEKEKRKILIFTESRDTLEYLKNKVERWGYSVSTIHGGMKLDDRINAEVEFKTSTDILIATEAAGEGINLQFCNLMINFDIPWNPNRLEQRMGRIHRYGQTREVFIHNLVAENTREGRVLNKLFDKIEEIKNALGNDKVFDVLGELIDSKRFTQIMVDAAVSAKDMKEILKNVDIQLDENLKNNIKEKLGETLATHYIDYTLIKEMAQKAREYKLIPEYTQNFFIKAFEKAGGKIEKNKNNTYNIKYIPYEIKKIADDENFKKTYGFISKNYDNITFDKEIVRQNSLVNFVSFGHPLFEALLQWVEKFAFETLRQGTIFLDPDGKINGYIVLYEGEIHDGTGSIAGKRIFSLLYENNKIRPVSPAILWDLKEVESNPDFYNIQNEENIDIDKIKDETELVVIENLKNYLNEILQERKRQADIKRKYGIRSLEHLIIKLDEDLFNLERRKENGEDVDLVIYNKKESKKNYECSLEELKVIIEQEQNLTMNSPKYLGIIRVLPFKDKNITEMESDKEIEILGMNYVMEYERKCGRIPEDVSMENLGYDIRSVDNNGNIRYIEVKTRAQEGDIALTPNEWFKAQRFNDDYYLYVVFNAKDNPSLNIIQNPVKNLVVETKTELVRIFVKKEEIVNKKMI